MKTVVAPIAAPTNAALAGFIGLYLSGKTCFVIGSWKLVTDFDALITCRQRGAQLENCQEPAIETPLFYQAGNLESAGECFLSLNSQLFQLGRDLPRIASETNISRSLSRKKRGPTYRR